MKAALKRAWSLYLLSINIELEKRFDFFVEVILAPFFFSSVELIIWFSAFHYSNKSLIGGHDRNSYLGYALWVGFVTRLSSSWSFEFKIIEDIDKGRINAILLRPFSFFEYCLYMCLGQKTSYFITLIFPLTLTYLFHLPFEWQGFGLAFIITFVHFFFLYSLSFLSSMMAFFLNKSEAITYSKNMVLWVLTGELIPLDIFPENIKNIFMHLPFASAAYIPVGLITGRVDASWFVPSLISLLSGILFINLINRIVWRKAMKNYNGTGA